MNPCAGGYPCAHSERIFRGSWTPDGAATARSLRPSARRETHVEEVNELPGLIHSALSAARRDEGQTMAEYGVVLGVITLAIITAIAALSGAIEGAYNAVTAIL